MATQCRSKYTETTLRRRQRHGRQALTILHLILLLQAPRTENPVQHILDTLLEQMLKILVVVEGIVFMEPAGQLPLIAVTATATQENPALHAQQIAEAAAVEEAAVEEAQQQKPNAQKIGNALNGVNAFLREYRQEHVLMPTTAEL